MARPRKAPYTWIDPPATISAPEATEPMTVTSPSRNTTDWPDRTGLSSCKEDCCFGAGAGSLASVFGVLGGVASENSIMLVGPPPLIRGGRLGPRVDGSAPSM